jgi:hypothetical protein
MRADKTKKRGNAFFVVAVIIIAIIIGGYFVLFSGRSVVQPAINKTVAVNDSSQNQTLVLGNQTVSVVTNYKSITMIINTTHIVPVDIIGHDNVITIVNGKIDLYVSGNYDTIHAENVSILNKSITGTGDTVS